MGCLGVHFALSEAEVEKLKEIRNDAERLEWFQNEIEDTYFGDHPELMVESDKAWDAIHRALTDGTLTYDRKGIRSMAILGGQPLYSAGDYIMSLKTPEEVLEIARELAGISRQQFHEGYMRINERKYGFPKSEEDFDYTWDYLENIVSFYERAAEEKRFVLFTADQ